MIHLIIANNSHTDILLVWTGYGWTTPDQVFNGAKRVLLFNTLDAAGAYLDFHRKNNEKFQKVRTPRIGVIKG